MGDARRWLAFCSHQATDRGRQVIGADRRLGLCCPSTGHSGTLETSLRSPPSHVPCIYLTATLRLGWGMETHWESGRWSNDIGWLVPCQYSLFANIIDSRHMVLFYRKKKDAKKKQVSSACPLQQ